MHTPDLTDTERLILANQYEILAKLDPDDEAHYTQLAKNLRAGHKWLYSKAFESVSRVVDDDTHEFVYTILRIYGELKSSLEELDDKTGIDASLVNWPGFDGNSEVELLSLTGALIEADQFTSILGKPAINSHIPTVEVYRRMVSRWKALGSPHYPYSKDQIQNILAARRHS